MIARIDKVFPLLRPMRGGQMRLVAFITEDAQIRPILDHIGVDPEPQHAGHRYRLQRPRHPERQVPIQCDFISPF